MRLWDYIFPDDKEIIIWGAGENGRTWLEFLNKLGKRVCCFIDKNAKNMESGGDVRVIGISEHHVTASDILLVTPASGEEDILREAKELGYTNILLHAVLKFIPRDVDLNIENVFPPFGHFYSLYPDMRTVDEKYEDIVLQSESKELCDAIKINERKQYDILSKMNSLYGTIPDWASCDDPKESKYRFRKDNINFGFTDSLVLHFMIRLLKPNHYIEVGSGYTSALALDTNEFYMEHSVDMRFIEPYPELFYTLLKDSDDRGQLMIPQGLQDIPLSFFDTLDDGDILFIDSTHVTKFGSDVNYLFFHIFPRLKKGVYVHLHDICYPWQYPREWIKRGTGWNEIYLLRSFLQYNDSWEIVFYTNYMTCKNPDMFDVRWRNSTDLEGGSFWMRKTK